MFRYLGIFAIIAYILGWIAYLELSPGMGNVWWRTNTEGVKEFTPWGIWTTAVAPFKQGHGMFWTPSYWDINPWPALGILTSMLVLLWRPWDMADRMQVSLQSPHEDDKMYQ